MTEFDILSLHPSLIEAASWRLCSELVRRHPTQLTILNTFPGGGTYDCLTVYARDGSAHVLDANRTGSIHIGPGQDGDTAGRTWTDYLTANPKAFLLEVERLAGLEPGSGVPASTPETLTWRAFAAVASSHVLGVRQVRIQTGVDDSGYGPPLREDLFEEFPVARMAAGTPSASDPYDQPGHRFWFVTYDEVPQAAVESSTSRVWWTDGTEHHLFEDYTTRGRHLASTVARCLGPAVT